MITEKCLPELSYDDLENFQETFLPKIRSSGSKAEKEKYRCWLRIVYYLMKIYDFVRDIQYKQYHILNYNCK